MQEFFCVSSASGQIVSTKAAKLKITDYSYYDLEGRPSATLTRQQIRFRCFIAVLISEFEVVAEHIYYGRS